MTQPQTQIVYDPLWEKYYLWLAQCVNDSFSGFCRICNTNLSICFGLTSIKQHESSKLHLDNLADAVTNAEIIWTMRCINNNLPLEDSCGKLFFCMFSASEIAKHLAKDLTASKMKYIVQYGIAQYFEGFTRPSLKSSHTIGDAKRIVKDTIQCFGSSLNVPITKNLIETVKLAKQKCDDDSQVTTQSVPDSSDDEKEHREEDDEKVKELDDLNSRIKKISHGLEVADDIIQKSNDDMKACMYREKNKHRKQDLKTAKTRFITSMKRKQRLSGVQQSLVDKMKELKAQY